MSFLVVAVLALLWLGFFLPSFLQTRQSSSPYQSATTFQESLRRLGENRPPAAPAASVRPAAVTGTAVTGRRRVSRVSARRRDVLAGLSGVVVATALLAVSFGGWLVWAPLPATAVFLAYTATLRARVVRSRRGRTLASIAPATSLTVVAEDEVVLSVRRRAESTPPPAELDPLERVAG